MGEIAIWLALFGALVGAALSGIDGLFLGGLIGFLLGRTVSMGQRLQRAETMLAQLERRVLGGEESAKEEAEAKEGKAEEPADEGDTGWTAEPSSWQEAEEIIAPTASAATPETAIQPETIPEIEIPDLDTGERQQKPSFETRLRDAVTGFFTDGNVVVRVGIVVLFFGVAFLVKYAAERDLFPIEFRLASAALGGLALIALGWYLRRRRTAYALLIQGGGIGIFYITVYGAAKIYHLIPMGFAFALMVAIVALSAMLALLQDSRNLAAFGISGGFLAPILTSTGEGSHVMLFSYYALLNAGILGIAWFRAWRELNLLGFIFTFVIGAFWGANYYQPEYFNTTEPFLLLFFLFYVAIAVLFALRQPFSLRGYVDATLVFGVPVVGFALQAPLVSDIEYGLAWSAFILAAFYIVLATSLWRRQADGFRLLTESFLALGIAFATLAIPLAVDERWTASAWALEGAAILWIGLRQQRLLPRISGLMLQLFAGASCMLAVVFDSRPDEVAVLNATYLSAVLVAVAALFSAYSLYRRLEVLREWESPLHAVAMAWGLMWWFTAGAQEIERFVPWEYQVNALLLFFATSSALLLWLCQRLLWDVLRYPLMALLPIALLLSSNILVGSSSNHFFEEWGALPWLMVFAVQYRILWRLESQYTERQLRIGHSATLWLLLLVLTWEAHWWVREWLDNRGVWDFATWGVVPALFVALILGPLRRLRWPVASHNVTYSGEALLPVIMLSWLWVILAAGSSGDPWPLPYLPLLNPLELAQLFVLLMMLNWGWRNRHSDRLQGYGISAKLIWALLGVAGFVLLNEIVAHAVHHWGGTPYRVESLHRSMVFHAAISVVWTVTALLLAVFATRRGLRMLWFTGAALLGAVVIKLFLVDLSRSDTMERIVSFIVVGVLMLLIGYFSPLPPKQYTEEKR